MFHTCTIRNHILGIGNVAIKPCPGKGKLGCYSSNHRGSVPRNWITHMYPLPAKEQHNRCSHMAFHHHCGLSNICTVPSLARRSPNKLRKAKGIDECAREKRAFGEAKSKRKVSDISDISCVYCINQSKVQRGPWIPEQQHYPNRTPIMYQNIPT